MSETPPSGPIAEASTLATASRWVVIVVGAREGGNILPVQGFGYDSHIVLPLLAISIPAVAYTAQLVATRM